MLTAAQPDRVKRIETLANNTVYNTHSNEAKTRICMNVCLGKFITREYLQPKQSGVRGRRPY